jgi:hypothetical protein
MRQIIAALDQAGFGGATAADGRGASVRLQEARALDIHLD